MAFCYTKALINKYHFFGGLSNKNILLCFVFLFFLEILLDKQIHLFLCAKYTDAGSSENFFLNSQYNNNNYEKNNREIIVLIFLLITKNSCIIKDALHQKTFHIEWKTRVIKLLSCTNWCSHLYEDIIKKKKVNNLLAYLFQYII